MSYPNWVDEEWSEKLPGLRADGEGPGLEYKESFPRNTDDLAKEIAAFATSNGGIILIGVSDDGELVGIEGVDDAGERDLLMRRIGGICRGTVTPAITPTVKYAHESGKTVIVIIVPKGSQPLYYSKGRPYIRHLSESRPAEPHEVIEKISEWLSLSQIIDEDEDAVGEFLSRMATELIEVIINGEELNERNINPWLGLIQANFQQAGAFFRDAFLTNEATQLGLADDLKTLAETLDEAANHQLFLGRDSWKQLEGLVKDAVERATAIKRTHIDTHALSEASREHIRQSLLTASEKLIVLEERMQGMSDQGRLAEVQSEASEIGRTLLVFAHYDIDQLHEGLCEEVMKMGRELHLVETMRVTMDGGLSVRRILERISTSSEALGHTVRSIAE